MKLDNRIWVFLTVIVCAAVVAGGWFLGAQPQLAAASAADAQRTEAGAQNATVAAEIVRLEKAEQSKSELADKLAGLTKAVPPGVDGSGFLSELDGLLASSGAQLDSWNFGEPTAYVSPAPPAATTTSSASPSPSPSPSASASAAADAPAAETGPVGITPLTNPLITGENFITVSVSIQVTGDDAQVTSFLRQLQAGPRLILVNDVNKSVDDEGKTSLKVGGYVYVLRDPSTIGSSTTPAAPKG